MSNKTIGDYDAANSIDASTDYYLIEQSGVYKKINRNVGLGLSSAPLGTTDSQSPKNKTLDNTNTITVKDGNLTIQNSSSTTKQAIFSAASITAGQTRTFTFPDASGTIVTASGTVTLTNKTLTSPIINGGTIDNSTITVDSISGHTTSTLVTIANLQISNGVLNSANSVTATSIAVGAVQPQALVSGTGSGWSWQAWTPTWTNLTVTGSTVTARYIQIGKTVFFRISVVLGGGNAPSGSVSHSLPVTATNYAGTAGTAIIGNVRFLHSGTGSDFGVVSLTNTTTAVLGATGASGTYTTIVTISSTIPFAWADTDEISISGTYEAA